MAARRVRITVLATRYDAALAAAHYRADMPVGPCEHFHVGDVFVVGDPPRQPEGFACAWAWQDLQQVVAVLLYGGDFGQWMAEPRSFVACCTDGIKPVVFHVEALEEP